MWRASRASVFHYFLAIALTFVAFLLQRNFNGWLKISDLAFLFFIPGVLLTAWLGGQGPGLLATALGVLACDYFFLTPHTVFLNTLPENLWLGTMAAAGVVVSILSELRLKQLAELRERSRQSRQLADQAQASLSQLQGGLASLNEGITLADGDGRILMMNPAAMRMHGFAEADPPPKTLGELKELLEVRSLEGAPVAYEHWPLPRILRGESLADAEFQLRRQDTAHYWIAAIGGRVVRLPGGQSTLAVQTMRDITRQKFAERERQLLQAEVGQRAEELARLNQAKDEFLAMLSHELRNPLAPIVSSVHIMQARGLGGEPSIQRSLDMIERQTNQMTRLLDDLLDVSRITTGKISLRLAHHDLRELIHQAVDGCRDAIGKNNHTLALRLPEAPLWAEVDPARLMQIVANLLDNAVKYTPPHGRIALELAASDGDAVLRIRDNGIGISKELIPRVFELFRQATPALDRSQGGLGIGLTVVKRLAEMHGGGVAVSSPGLDLGSEFTVTLPLARGRAAAAPAPASDSASPEGSGLRVLIVEDNPDTALAMSEVLEIWGHDVRLAYDGPGALEVAAAYHPDFILLDIGLPDIDGYQVSRELRRWPGFSQTVIIAITGYGQAEDIRTAYEAGINHHFTKPVDLPALKALIKAP